MSLRFFVLAAALLGCAGSASAQNAASPAKPAAAPSTYAVPAGLPGTYAYRTFTVYASGQAPLPAEGVGGTLTLHSTGVFEKRLELSSPQGPMTFNQRGRFTVSGDKISFAYLDSQQEPKADNGTFRFDPRKRTLEVTIEGYPAGSKGVYTLTAQKGPQK